MPHDANGNVLKKGDKVNIPCTILDVYTVEEYCNCNLEFDIPMPPKETKDTYSAINTRQVIKAE